MHRICKARQVWFPIGWGRVTLMANQPHHADPRFRRAKRRLQRAARLDPLAICWRCGRTLPEHPRHDSGAPPIWHCGHTIARTYGPPWLNLRRRPPAGRAWIALEASTCNIVAGNDARVLNADTGYPWP